MEQEKQLAEQNQSATNQWSGFLNQQREEKEKLWNKMNKLEEEKEKFWNKMKELEEFSNQQREEKEKLWNKMNKLEEELSEALDQIKKAKTSSCCFNGIMSVICRR